MINVFEPSFGHEEVASLSNVFSNQLPFPTLNFDTNNCRSLLKLPIENKSFFPFSADSDE